MDCAQSTAAVVDEEVKSLLDDSYAAALSILGEHRALLDEIAEFLLMKETITGEELMRFIESSATRNTEEPSKEEPNENPQE